MKKVISVTAMCRLFFVVSLLFSCKKSEKNVISDPLPERTIQFTADFSGIKPGMLVTLTTNKASDISSISTTLGGKEVSIVKIDSFQYAFCIPVLPPGNYTLDLTKLKAANNLSLTMSDYTVITDPKDVITQTINHYNKITDSLVAVGVASTKEGQYIHQLTDQLSEYMKNASADENQLMAYQAQSILSQTNSNIAKLQTVATAFPDYKYNIVTPKSTSDYVAIRSFNKNNAIMIAAGNNTFDWISLSLDNSKEFSDKSAKAAHASTGATLALDGGLKCLLFAATLAALPQVFPIPQAMIGAAGGGVVLLLSAAVLKIYAKKLNDEIAKEEYLPEHIENSEPNTPLVFSKTKEVVQRLTGGFRNIIKSDENTSNTDVAGYVQSNNKLSVTDNKVKIKIDEIKAKFGFLFSKVVGTYDAYISPVLTKATEKTKRLIPKYITVSNISNLDIDLQVGEDAYQQLLLSAANRKNNIKSKVSFTYTAIYTQPATGKKVSTTQQATFDGDTVPVKVYKIGDQGPNMGIVFYDKGSYSSDQVTVENNFGTYVYQTRSNWRYLEYNPIVNSGMFSNTISNTDWYVASKYEFGLIRCNLPVNSIPLTSTTKQKFWFRYPINKLNNPNIADYVNNLVDDKSCNNFNISVSNDFTTKNYSRILIRHF